MSTWPRLKIVPSGATYEQRLQQAIERWEGTRYYEGMQRCRVGVDCVRFVCAIADEMAGTKTPIAKLPNDKSLHDPEGARMAFLVLMRLFGARRIQDPGYLEPGDVIVCGPKEGGPGHAMIVGLHSLYHSTSGGVQTADLQPCGTHTEFHAILRVRNREQRWARH